MCCLCVSVCVSVCVYVFVCVVLCMCVYDAECSHALGARRVGGFQLIYTNIRENLIDTCARWMGSAAVARGPAGKGVRQVFDLTACTPLIPISD